MSRDCAFRKDARCGPIYGGYGCPPGCFCTSHNLCMHTDWKNQGACLKAQIEHNRICHPLYEKKKNGKVSLDQLVEEGCL